MRRVLLIVCTLLALTLLGLFLAFDSIVESKVEDAFARLERRLGLPLRFARAHTDGLDTVVVHGIEVGPVGAPQIAVDSVAVVLDTDAMWSLQVVPSMVQIERPVLNLSSGGSPAGLYQSIKVLLPPPVETPAATSPAAPARKSRTVPAINVDGGRVVDADGLVELVDGELTYWKGRLQGQFNVQTPELGPCHFAGTHDALSLRCDRPYAHPLPGGFQLEVEEFKIDRSMGLKARVPRIQLRQVSSDGGLLASILSGLSIDITLDLANKAAGPWPLETRLVLPGGGEIVGTGVSDLNGFKVSAQVDGLQLGKAHEAVSGTLSGRYTVHIDRRNKNGTIDGEGRIEGLKAEHPSLADGPIGPFDMGLSGRLTGKVKSVRKRIFSVTLEDGKGRLGELEADFKASLSSEGEAFLLKASFELPQVPGPDLIAAVPPGLLPNLEPLETRGLIGMTADLEIDSRDYKATKLNIDIPMKKFAITGMNRKIDFDRLRHLFTSRFEVPGEYEGEFETLTRESGPLSDRWVPLDEVTPLLPKAIRTQEDGGFYNHGGISLLHLRGSLIRNLERGRFARGGSTITMQLARNLFLNRRKTLARKLEEIVLAWLLEQEFDKDELMAIYVNLVEFGPDLYGIQEASRHYFDKEPDQLTPPEVAWIVRLLPGPRLFYSMFQKGRLTRGHTNSINRLLRLLVKKEHLTAAEATPIERDTLWPNGTGGRPKKTPKRKVRKPEEAPAAGAKEGTP